MPFNTGFLKFWLDNARVRNGLPPDPMPEASTQADSPAPSASVELNTDIVGTLSHVRESPVTSWAKVGLAGVSIAATVLGVDAFRGYLKTGLEDSKNPPAVSETSSSDSSLYQHLEDGGFHIPE